MTSLMPSIVLAVIVIILVIPMITAAVVAHRGKSFWGTWMMLLGAIAVVLGTIATVVASYFLIQNIASVPSSTPGSASSVTNHMAIYSAISGIAALLTAAGLLFYLIGLLGLAFRYGAVFKRIVDLETINASLISQQEQSSR